MDVAAFDAATVIERPVAPARRRPPRCHGNGLSASLGTRSLEPHQPLFFEGDSADFLYQVEDGVLCNHRVLPDGRRQIVSFAYPGELIGLGDARTHRASCEAIGRARVRRISRRALMQDAGTSAELGSRLFEMAAAELSELQEHQILLGRKSAVERLAAFLMSLIGRLGHRPGGALEIELPMTRADIADFLGLTIETVSRNLSKLRATGIIDLPQSKTVAIRDIDRLRQLADGAEEAA